MIAYRTASDLPRSRRLKAAFGKLLGTLRPSLLNEVRRRPFSGGWGGGGRLMRNALLAEAVEQGDHETLQRFHFDYWASNTADEFYDHFAHRFEDVFLRHHAGVIDLIASALPQLGEGVRLVEAGPGDGRLLAHLATRLAEITEFHGIDLNGGQVAKCSERYREEKGLHFHEDNVVRWLDQNPAPATILMSNGGVFEYFLRDELLALFQSLRESGAPCLVALTETMALDHDLEAERVSIPYGLEFSFSHHYPAILEEAGYQVLATLDRPTDEIEENHPSRWFQAVAIAVS